jgi:HAMP domain-containing protein
MIDHEMKAVVRQLERELSEKTLEVEKLRKLVEVAIEVAEDALEERDLKRRIADEIGSLKAELNRLTKS